MTNVQRRQLLKTATVGSLGVPLALGSLNAQADGRASGDNTLTNKAMQEFNRVLAEKNASFGSKDWNLSSPAELAEGRRMLLHTANHALDAWLEADPERPVFKRWHTPEKKILGDNPNSLYYDSPISADHEYRIKGNIAGATYTSFTVEIARGTGASGQLGAVLNDTDFDIDKNGDYELILSADKPKKKAQRRNWLQLAPGARSITTRHYFETKANISADRLKHIPMVISRADDPGPRPKPTDASVAAGVTRAARWLDATVFPPSVSRSPHWVSQVPNQFTPPKKDKTNEAIGYAAADNVYAMTNFSLQDDEALIIRGRWPKCRFANIVLQNLFMQTLDYEYRQISVNRKQTVLEKDGSFKLIVAHSDPGLPNWLDTEGRNNGVVFCRFQLPEEAITPLETTVVKLNDIV